jgi:hypothetical protein
VIDKKELSIEVEGLCLDDSEASDVRVNLYRAILTRHLFGVATNLWS